MPAYLTSSIPTETDPLAQASRGRISLFLLRQILALFGLVAVSAVARAVVAAPVFSPVTGTYLSAQTMTLSTATSGASIAYTTDGSTPTESGGTITHGSLYTIPLTISATTTLQAIAFASGNTDSPVTSATYTINSLPIVAAPIFSPGGGTYTSVQPVMITSATSGATIRYTTNGSTPSPTVGTLFYPGSLTIGATTTLNAIAYEAGYSPSAVTSAGYTINLPTPAAAPVFSPGGGTYTSVQSVAISSTTSGTSIAYTTDGTTPTEVGGTITHGSLYTGAISMNTTIVLQAIAFGGGHTDSPMTSAFYEINLPPPAGAPVFSAPSGTYTYAFSVTVGSATSGAFIVYTTDGSTPTESGGTVTHGTLYNGTPIQIWSSTTLEAIAFATGYSDSALVTVNYTLNIPAAAQPTFSQPGGTYTTNQGFLVTVSTSTPNCNIVYTLDGSTPTWSNGTTTHGITTTNGPTVGYGPGAISFTLKALAVGNDGNHNPSSVVTASYNIVLPAADPPGFSPPSGNYNVSSGGTFSVTVSTDTPSINSSQAIIVFNTNGNTPTYTIDSNGIITATNGSGLIYNGNQVGWTIPGGHGHGSVSINALAIVNGYVIPTAVSSASYNLTW